MATPIRTFGWTRKPSSWARSPLATTMPIRTASRNGARKKRPTRMRPSSSWPVPGMRNERNAPSVRERRSGGRGGAGRCACSIGWLDASAARLWRFPRQFEKVDLELIAVHSEVKHTRTDEDAAGSDVDGRWHAVNLAAGLVGRVTPHRVRRGHLGAARGCATCVHLSCVHDASPDPSDGPRPPR